MEGALEEIENLAFVFEFLSFQAKFVEEVLQIGMVAVHELAAQFAEHTLVEIVSGEHAPAPTIARFKHNRSLAGLVQARSARQHRRRRSLSARSIPTQKLSCIADFFPHALGHAMETKLAE